MVTWFTCWHQVTNSNHWFCEMQYAFPYVSMVKPSIEKSWTVFREWNCERKINYLIVFLCRHTVVKLGARTEPTCTGKLSNSHEQTPLEKYAPNGLHLRRPCLLTRTLGNSIIVRKLNPYHIPLKNKRSSSQRWMRETIHERHLGKKSNFNHIPVMQHQSVFPMSGIDAKCWSIFRSIRHCGQNCASTTVAHVKMCYKRVAFACFPTTRAFFVFRNTIK